MLPHVLLTGVSPDALYAWLPECIELARQELALHPLRPQPTAMIPYKAPLHELYLFARHLATAYFGVYEALPQPAPPFGTPLMLLGVGLRGFTAAPGDLSLGIWRRERFPLDLPEIAWLLEQRFPCKPAPGSPLTHYLRPADLKPESPTHRPPPPEETVGHRPPESARPPRRGGLLPSTLWLVDRIADLPDPVDPEPFYQEWADIYKANEGLHPRDSARSFDQAVDSAFKQLGRGRRKRRG